MKRTGGDRGVGQASDTAHTEKQDQTTNDHASGLKIANNTAVIGHRDDFGPSPDLTTGTCPIRMRCANNFVFFSFRSRCFLSEAGTPFACCVTALHLRSRRSWALSGACCPFPCSVALKRCLCFRCEACWLYLFIFCFTAHAKSVHYSYSIRELQTC